MKVCIFGATGVLGREMVPLFMRSGHELRIVARDPGKASGGVEVVEGDLLAPGIEDKLPDIVAGCEAVIHAATAIPRDSSVPGAWTANTRLRTEGTRRLLDACLRAGVKRYVQQSIVMAYVDGGDRWLDESTPLDTSPQRARICGPVNEMESMVRETPLEWCILRGGAFEGPGTSQDALVESIRAGREVVPCDGSYYISPINPADMAAAVVAAVERAPADSTYNIVAEPLRYGEYVDRIASLLGVPPPARDPSRSCPPSFRCSNEAAKRDLGWRPTHSIWPVASSE